MKQSVLLWVAAILMTLSAATYQRMTGPTYPMRGKEVLGGESIKYRFERSHGGADAQVIRLKVPSADWKGTLEWKRYKTNDAWTPVAMQFENGELSGDLPGQPPAGKLMYHIKLERGNDLRATVPAIGDVVIRFKGRVPLFILIPHVIAMFSAMLLATRAGIQAVFRPHDLKRFAFWTIGLFTFGGLVLGPLVQLYAFGALWTGWPFGTDLTDNKTLIAWFGWFVAIIAIYKTVRPRYWVLAAAVIMWGVYLIPHSMFGSELDYKKLDQRKQASLSASG